MPTGPNRTEAGEPEQHEREAGEPEPHAGDGVEATLDAREAEPVVKMAREGDEPVMEAALIVPTVPGRQMVPEEGPGFDRNNHRQMLRGSEPRGARSATRRSRGAV